MTQSRRVPKPRTFEVQPTGDKVSKGVVQPSRQIQKAPIYVSKMVPELSVDDHNRIDESVPNINSDSEEDVQLQEALKRSRIETHGGASSSAPLSKRARTHQSESTSTQQEDEGLGEDNRMVEDADIAFIQNASRTSC